MAMDRSSRPMHRGRKKVCSFCVDRIDRIDYKDLPRLRKYVSERSKIIPRRVTGTCAFHQRELTVAIKRARHMALYAVRQRFDFKRLLNKHSNPPPLRLQACGGGFCLVDFYK